MQPKIVYADAPYITNNNDTNNTDGIVASKRIAESGMAAQSERLKIVSQNIANSEVTGMTPEDPPYRRKIIFFHNEHDDKLNAEMLAVEKIDRDKSDFILKYQPHHPAADNHGYVKYPNINIVIETADAKEAQRSFEANTNALMIAKSLEHKTLELMR